ncbi:MAG: hypothetical protein HY980_03280 [Candidatus Magasanikbacteria bacterium]|nr:hypothetical protein [Candidatus Magasanikbacteria bacterium]
MQVYKAKVDKTHGSTFGEACRNASSFYLMIKKKTKRRPFVRSAYFNKEKIFLELFWRHLHEKLNHRDKLRRVRYFACAMDLIQNSHFDPLSKDNPNKASEVLHRFAGITKGGDKFFVQIKEYKKNGQKWLVSVFPDE